MASGSRTSASTLLVAPPGAGQQRLRVDQDHGVVVGVDDPGLRRDGLGDLVGVVSGGPPGADVEELPDACLTCQVADGADQEAALQPGELGDAGEHLQDQVAVATFRGGSAIAEAAASAEDARAI
jgi:hypothetical protein